MARIEQQVRHLDHTVAMLHWTLEDFIGHDNPEDPPQKPIDRIPRLVYMGTNLNMHMEKYNFYDPHNKLHSLDEEFIGIPVNKKGEEKSEDKELERSRKRG